MQGNWGDNASEGFAPSVHLLHSLRTPGRSSYCTMVDHSVHYPSVKHIGSASSVHPTHFFRTQKANISKSAVHSVDYPSVNRWFYHMCLGSQLFWTKTTCWPESRKVWRTKTSTLWSSVQVMHAPLFYGNFLLKSSSFLRSRLDWTCCRIDLYEACPYNEAPDLGWRVCIVDEVENTAKNRTKRSSLANPLVVSGMTRASTPICLHKSAMACLNTPTIQWSRRASHRIATYLATQ